MGKEATPRRRRMPKPGARGKEGCRKKRGAKCRRKARVRRPPDRRRPPGATSVGLIIGVVDQASETTTHPRSFDVPDCYRIHWKKGCDAYAPFCKCSAEDRKLRLFGDVSAGLLLQQQRPDLFVDLIYPRDVTPARLARNDVNFIAGYDALCAHLDAAAGDASMVPSAAHARAFAAAVRAAAGRVRPPASMQRFGTDKRAYYQRAMDVGVPIAPTMFARSAAERAPAAIVRRARSRGWDHFVVKPSFGSWNMGVAFFNLKGRGAEQRVLDKLAKHMRTPEVSKSPDVVVQQYMQGFAEHPEMRTFFGPDGKYLYAVANWRAGAVTMTTQRAALPEMYLGQAKEIGQMAVERMIPARSRWVTRVDVACQSMGRGKLRFFMNEIDPTGSNNWHSARYPGSVALMARLFAEAADRF